MQLSLDEEELALLSEVRRFVQKEIVPLEHDMDPDAVELDPENYARLVEKTKEMGLYNLELPEEFGGPGISTTLHCLIAMETSQHRAGLYAAAYNVFGHPGQIPLLSAYANDDQKERYLYPSVRGEKKACFALSEASGGSDPGRSIITRAVQDGDDWIINGSKLWISGALEADFAVLFARTGGPGRDGVTAFLVDTDTPGFTVSSVVHTLRSTKPGTEIALQDVRVPSANILGGLGNGFKMANHRLAKNRIPYSAACVGVAVKAQELAVEYAKVRQAFGENLIDHQGLNWMLVENEMDIRNATMMVLLAADRADRGLPFRSDAAAAKIAATEAAARVVDRAIQVHGGMGVSKEMPLERWYRELRIRRIGEGATEVQKMLVGRELKYNPYKFFLY
ncbi:acyl-CoA dehydrogenase family protein [Microbacterium gorillae]|uniref:acyl-CoA dehydrogenase family protein n=1 Tax=Microbacterium gorillae TaxID=1231063 RepID=UPI0005914128|nr:acyl-CoA dehydrogenase family protein [Microbacterium gorillae]